MEKLAFSINGVSIDNAGGAPTGGLTLKGAEIIRVILTYFYIAAIILALLFLIWGGFNWITSEGDKQKLAQAREKITFSVIGLIVVFLAYLVVVFIGNFFGVGLLQTSGG